MSWSQQHNNTMDCPLTPTLRVSWSRVRCWHGETITISVRSTYVKDGGTIDLEIWEQSQPALFDTIAPQIINGNSLDVQYQIDWKAKVIPPNAWQFYVIAKLQNPATTSPNSDPLSVDLVHPIFSA